MDLDLDMIYKIDLPIIDLPPGIWAWRAIRSKLLSVPQYLLGLCIIMGLVYLADKILR